MDTAHLVGLSLGGAIAQVCALTRPERIGELATVATQQRAFLQRGAAAQAGGIAGVLATTITRFTRGALAVNAWPVRYARDQVLRADPDTWAARWRALAGVDTSCGFPSYARPRGSSPANSTPQPHRR